MSAAGLCAAAGITAVIITFVGCIALWIASKPLLLAVGLFLKIYFIIQISVVYFFNLIFLPKFFVNFISQNFLFIYI